MRKQTIFFIDADTRRAKQHILTLNSVKQWVIGKINSGKGNLCFLIKDYLPSKIQLLTVCMPITLRFFQAEPMFSFGTETPTFGK